MRDRPHLRFDGREQALAYTNPRRRRGHPRVLPSRDRRQHAAALQRQLREAEEAAAEAAGVRPDGLKLDFRSEPGIELALESLEFRPSGIVLDSVHQAGAVQVATVFVPAGKLEFFIKRLEAYAVEDTPKGKAKHEALVAAIAEIRPAALRSFWTDADALYPGDARTRLWWEVWLRRRSDQPPAALVQQFIDRAEAQGLTVNRRFVAFPERVVLLAWGSIEQWTGSPTLMNMVAELRRAKELITPFLDLRPSEQGEFVEEARQRLQPPEAEAPAVCLLDTGVAQSHPLLAPALAAADVLAVDPAWDGSDCTGHGTRMAGIGLYGPELAEFLAGNHRVTLQHRLESVRLLPPAGQNDPELYGALTQEAMARAEVRNPRRQRVACLAVTASERDQGRPSAWSAALDEHSAGVLDGKRWLYVVSAGNLDVITDLAYAYPDSNQVSGIQDPAQAWNALTVGACTQRVLTNTPGYQPLAPAGGLCPSSRTSLPWTDETWPYKPDLCAEGGNYAVDADGRRDCLEELQLLTTVLSPEGRLLGLMRDTSAATAQVARCAAILQGRYPALWPETIRALLVHSARWTPAMETLYPGVDKATIKRRLRCFGYGMPDLGRAIASRDNQVTLIYEGALRPFREVGGEVKTHQYHLHPLPWPRPALQALGAADVTVRVTLSYFIEPSPGNCGWGVKHRYQSHGLRFDMLRPGETAAAFRQRVSKPAADDAPARPGTAGGAVPWVVGPNSRNRGSLHSDWWTGSAADVAGCGQIAVYPVKGWWSGRPHLGRHDHEARYSLIVSVETATETAELYAAIETLLALPVAVV